MKKNLLVISGILIIILLFIVYLLYNYERDIKKIEQANKQYEAYYQKDILGNDLATLLNKVMDQNEKNHVEKDEKDVYYLDNGKDSLIVQIKFLGTDEPIRMENILKQDIQNFIKYYATYTFKCTKLGYHQDTKKVKSLYFEEQTTSK